MHSPGTPLQKETTGLSTQDFTSFKQDFKGFNRHFYSTHKSFNTRTNKGGGNVYKGRPFESFREELDPVSSPPERRDFRRSATKCGAHPVPLKETPTGTSGLYAVGTKASPGRGSTRGVP